ncbi:hypothetical protein MTR67_027412 [Solanum verrucosum]|uniref:CS domain-containing protein n=1 Tax=Solanum verrucosum TaxID=315347 RepID=A0AAF0TUU2_SOLVR|nr:hypothetical protein MTR67_027412 [Solanum verrucosum]
MVIISEYNEQDDKLPSSSHVSPKPSNETKVKEVKEAINATEAIDEDKKGLGLLTSYVIRRLTDVKEAINTTEAIEENKKGLLGLGLLTFYVIRRLTGELYRPVKVEACFWTLEDQKSISVLLTKIDKMNWWKWVVKGEPELDIEKVEPEITRLSELDPEIQSSVETIMFDQRHEAMGLPTLDEMQNQEMLKFIMEKYPWMDFSRAKKS